MFVASLTPCYAWHKSGKVFCDSNLSGVVDEGDIPVADVVVVVKGLNGFQASATTDANGAFYITLLDVPATYTAYLDKSTLPKGTTAVAPDPETFETTRSEVSFDNNNFLIQNPGCVPNLCWFTGGGAYIDPISGQASAIIQKKNIGRGTADYSFGGNVYPGCNPDSGEGGSWNHVDRILKLHFHGTTMTVVRCGNVADIPPGSTSPVTPFNFIEFEGMGWVKGIHGNKTDLLVTFFARCEDRNEPGSKGAKDGALIDRYYLQVKDGNNVVLQVGEGNPYGATDVTPVPITDGNFQLHISSCDNPPLW